MLTKLYWWLKSARADARLVGLGVFKHRFCWLAGIPECAVRLRGAGPIVLRPRDSDLASFRGIFNGGEYEFPTAAVEAAARRRYEAILAGGKVPVIVDAGAYIGASTLWFRSKFPRAHIVAIEPDADNFSLLERNVPKDGQATLVRAAVGATGGHVKIVATPESWATQVERSEAGTRVVTLNEALAMIPGGEPFMAKINIEGFESELFSANLEWLDQVAVMFIEPHDWLLPGKHTSRSFQQALGKRDFELFIVGPHLCYARL